MKKYAGVTLFSLFFVWHCMAWQCPDLSHGKPGNLSPFEIYRSHLKGDDAFKKMIITRLGVTCLYRHADPTRALILMRVGHFAALKPYLPHWHQVGAGTSAMYCTDSIAVCEYH